MVSTLMSIMKVETRDCTLLLACELFLYFESSKMDLRWIESWSIGYLVGPEQLPTWLSRALKEPR